LIGRDVSDPTGRVLLAAFAEPEQVEVLRQPMCTTAPSHEKRGALENEGIPLSTLAQPEQESFAGVSHEQ
jgi:hypothetical protein